MGKQKRGPDFVRWRRNFCRLDSTWFLLLWSYLFSASEELGRPMLLSGTTGRFYRRSTKCWDLSCLGPMRCRRFRSSAGSENSMPSCWGPISRRKSDTARWRWRQSLNRKISWFWRRRLSGDLSISEIVIFNCVGASPAWKACWQPRREAHHQVSRFRRICSNRQTS